MWLYKRLADVTSWWWNNASFPVSKQSTASCSESYLSGYMVSHFILLTQQKADRLFFFLGFRELNGCLECPEKCRTSCYAGQLLGQLTPVLYNYHCVHSVSEDCLMSHFFL